jgi:hypothetical protein
VQMTLVFRCERWARLFSPVMALPKKLHQTKENHTPDPSWHVISCRVMYYHMTCKKCHILYHMTGKQCHILYHITGKSAQLASTCTVFALQVQIAQCACVSPQLCRGSDVPCMLFCLYQSHYYAQLCVSFREIRNIGNAKLTSFSIQSTLHLTREVHYR